MYVSTRNALWILIHPRTCWVCDILVIKHNTFLDFLCRLVPTYGSPRTWQLGFGFWMDSLSIFPASSDIRIQITHRIIFARNLRWWSKWHIYLLVNDFSRFHHNNFRDTTSWECIVKDDCITSCLIELQSFPLSKLYIDPIHRILVPTFARTMQDGFLSNHAHADLCVPYARESRL